MTEWSVLIHGVGVRVVVSEDIDGAYAIAMKEYECKLEDILSVFKLVNNYLDPGGIFIFDMNTPYKYKKILY